jgi:hypothetical protein
VPIIRLIIVSITSISVLKVDVATSLRIERPENGNSVPQKARHFSLLHSVQIVWGIPNENRGLPQLGCEADHSPPYSNTFTYAVVARCLIKHKDTFSLVIIILLLQYILDLKD